MGRHHRFAAAALAATAVLAGCDSDPPQTTPTVTAPGTSQTTTSTNSSAQAPPVKQPLVATRFDADACQSLTEFQRRSLSLAGGTSDPPGKCDFASAGTEIVVKLIYYSNNTSGLSALYEAHSQGSWEYWEPTELDGYPAVLYEVSPNKTKLSCEVAVGISDSLYFSVRYVFYNGDPGGKNPCVEGRAVASAVLSTIKTAK